MPTRERETYDLLIYEEGSGLGVVRQWPVFRDEHWRITGAVELSTILDDGWEPISSHIRTRWFGLRQVRVWVFRRRVRLEEQYQVDGPGRSARRITPDTVIPRGYYDEPHYEDEY